jgi:hypothetical protein
MKNLFVKLTLIALIGSFFTQALSAQTSYVIRIVQTEDKADSPVLERMIQGVLKEIHNSNRIDILPATSTAGAATHLAEVSTTYNVVENNLSTKSFNDSTGIISFNWTYRVEGSVDLLITEVETGKIITNRSIRGKGASAENYQLTYKDTGWAKGKSQQDEKEKQQLLTKAKSLLTNKSSNLYNSGANAMITNLIAQSRFAPNQIFPYRLKVLEATETKKDGAEKVLIEGGKAYDLVKGDRLVVYTTNKITVNGKNYEHFEILGRLKYENDHERGGNCDVSKGKEKILTALKSGQPLWCRAGDSPYTIAEKTEDVKIAIGSFITPKDVSPKLREMMYRRLRVQTLGRKGFTVLEREKLSGIQAEKDLQKQEEFIEKAAVGQFNAVGAELIVEIKFLEPVIDIDREFMTNKILKASVTVAYAMRLLDVATGEVLNERNGRSTKYFEQADAAQVESSWNANRSGFSLERMFYHRALSGVWFDIVGLLNEVFPPKIIVAEITDEKKDKADELLLVGEINMKSSDKFFVMRKTMVNVDGQELPRFEQVGLVALRDAEGEGVINAKVKEGGREIYAAMKAGVELFCVDKPNMLERLGKWGNNRMERYGY